MYTKRLDSSKKDIRYIKHPLKTHIPKNYSLWKHQVLWLLEKHNFLSNALLAFHEIHFYDS